MNKFVNYGAGLAGIMLVSACGGGGGGSSSSVGDVGGNNTPANYEKMDSAAQKTSNLSGIYISTKNYSTGNTSGLLTHNSGALSLSAGGYRLDDKDGPTRDGNVDTYQDGSTTAIVDASGDYEYVSEFLMTDDNWQTAATGYVGVATEAKDVPTSGSAIYHGEAVAYVTTDYYGSMDVKSLRDGESKVKAKFDSRTVDADLYNFKTVTNQYGSASTAPIDKIEVRNMKISGSNFSGGRVTTMKDGQTVNATGSNTTSETHGSFHGYDTANSIPDEVSGMLTSEGDSGAVYGMYVAD